MNSVWFVILYHTGLPDGMSGGYHHNEDPHYRDTDEDSLVANNSDLEDDDVCDECNDNNDEINESVCSLIIFGLNIK